MSARVYRLELPRWDQDYRLKQRGRRVVLDPKTGKPKRWRPVFDALHGNARQAHWATRARATREVIECVTAAALAAGVPAGLHLTVQLHWAPGDRRRADADNLWPLQKACCDALARGRADLPGLHLVPDDTPAYMSKLGPEIHPPPANGLWLSITTGAAP